MEGLQRAYAPALIMRARDVSNPDIRRRVVKEARNVARSVRWAKMPDREAVPRMLHEYLTDRVPYVEQGSVQSIRRPAALVGGRMSADCKSTAVFAAGLGAAAGCDVVVRFAQYPGRAWLSHVYAIVDGVVVDPLLPFGSEDRFDAHEDHTIQMELEVIQGTASGRVGAQVTTMFSPNELLAQATDWATWPGFKWPDGNGGFRVRFWPFSGPTAAMLSTHFTGNSFPGAFFGVRLLSEQEVVPGYAFAPGLGQQPGSSYYYYTQPQADASIVALRDYCEFHMRERLGLTPDEPIPASAWDEQTIPYTREANSVIGGFIAGLTDFFARFLPIMVLARTAFLSLVSSNYRGLARKMADNDPARVRERWNRWGGNWASLQRAITTGRDKSPTGINGIGKGDNDMSGGSALDAAAGASGFGPLLAAAKPILDVVLQALGISLDGEDEDTSAHDDITSEVDEHVNEGGSGLVWVGLGIVAAVVLSSSSKRRTKAATR